MNHPTQQEIFDHADGTGERTRSAEISEHILNCDRCRTAHNTALAMGRALRRLEPDHPSAHFTAKLLNRLGLKEATPLWWLFFRNFAPVLAAGAVAGVILMLGSAGQGAEGASARKSLFDSPLVGGAVKDVTDGFLAWTGSLVTRYLSFSIGQDSVSQVVFLVFLFGGIGLLDRYVLGPMLRRRN